MVPGGGIEPTTLSLEGFCSSTELPGHRTAESIFRIEKKSKEFSREWKVTYKIKILEVYPRIHLFIISRALYINSINVSFSQNLGIYLLSHVKPRSTIDVTKLNFCVRNGNRCTLRTIYTKILEKKKCLSKKCFVIRNIVISVSNMYKILFIPTNKSSSKNKKHI